MRIFIGVVFSVLIVVPVVVAGNKNKYQPVYDQEGTLTTHSVSPIFKNGQNACYDGGDSVYCSDNPEAGVSVILQSKNNPKEHYLVDATHPLDAWMYKGVLHVEWISKYDPLLDAMMEAPAGKPTDIHYLYWKNAVLHLGDIKQPGDNVICMPWTSKNGKKQKEVCYDVR